MIFVSNLVIPLMVLVIMLYGIYKKVDLYNEFLNGASESFGIVLKIFPCFLAMILGINIFLKSGILELILNLVEPVLKSFHFPVAAFPMALMRPISGSSTIAILNNIFSLYGPDSFIGRLGSVIQGSTDTTFYVITLYFGSIGIKKIRYALWAGLFADLVGIIASVIIVNMIF